MASGWGVVSRDHRYITGDRAVIEEIVRMRPDDFVGADYLDAGIVTEEQHHSWWRRLDEVGYYAAAEPFRDLRGNLRVATTHFALLPGHRDLAIFTSTTAGRSVSRGEALEQVQASDLIHDSDRFHRLIRQAVAEVLLAHGLPIPAGSVR